jgi:hypothetical protein
MKMDKGMRKLPNTLVLLLWVSIPLVLIWLPANFFDKGQSLCLSVFLFEMECWACGLTRGTMHLIHFDFFTAYEFNKGSFVLFPLLLYLWLKVLGQLRNRVCSKQST